MPRANLTDAVEWIALNDEAGDLDPKTVAEYISTQLVADIFKTPVALVAERIVAIRKRFAREQAKTIEAVRQEGPR